MDKPKKEKTPKGRPHKYEDKLSINTDFEGVFKVIKKHKEQSKKKG